MIKKNTPNLPLPNPDFDTQRNMLKKFLSTQDELKDYDFDGSTLAVLLDVLAYNSSMNAFMLNMVGNEANLSTAIRRSSIVSKAQDLGYIPSSAKSSSVELYLEYSPTTATPQSGIRIPAGTVFGAMNSGVSYMFNTIDDVFATYNVDNGMYTVPSVKAYEGRQYTHKYTVSSSQSPNAVVDVTGVGITIPNLNVDDSTMQVHVMDPAVSTEYSLYTRFSGDLTIGPRTQSYFISETETGHINIKFGDGVIGRSPGIGSVIKVTYIISSGPDANGVAAFNQTTAIDGGSLHNIIPLSPSSGGTWGESNESIQFNAPLSYEAQNRGVLAADYEFLTRQAYPAAKGVIAWGGEDNDPPKYGSVFITVQPQHGSVITRTDKADIERYLLSKSSITTRPVIVDPDYVYLDVESKVYYNPQYARKVAGELETAVHNAIVNFSDVELSTFKSSLIFSKFISMIDSVDPGITMSDTTITLGKRFTINLNVPQQTTVNFSNSIEVGSITSSRFTFSGFENCFIGSHGPRSLAIYTQRGGKTSLVATEIGSVDHESGLVTINPIIFEEADAKYFDNIMQRHFISIRALPKSKNAFTSKNQILRIDEVNITSENIV